MFAYGVVGNANTLRRHHLLLHWGVDMRVDYAKEIKARVDIREVASLYGLVFNRAGYACCPYHNEKTGSFKIQNSQYAHCFGCGENADAVSLTMHLLGIDFKSALKQINKDFALGFDIDGKPNLKQQRELRRRMEQLEAEREEQTRKEAEIQALRDLWCMYDRWRTEYKPTDLDNIDPRYFEAITKISEVEYKLDALLDEQYAEKEKKKEV